MWCGGNGNQNKPLQIIFSFRIHCFIAYSNELAHAYICYQRAARSPSHADVYTHCHTAQSHTLVSNTHPHAGCLHSYCCSPHPVTAIATETSLTASLFLQMHPHFYSLWKNIFLYLFFFPLTHTRNSPCLPSICLCVSSGCLI